MGQQKILKILSIVLVFFMLVTTSVQDKRVKAEPITVSTFAIGLIFSGLCAAGLISANYSVTPTQLGSIQSKIEEGGETLVSGVNALGNAIKSGADKATVQALASGATIYGVLNAIQDVLFPKRSDSLNAAIAGYSVVRTKIDKYGDSTFYLVEPSEINVSQLAGVYWFDTGMLYWSYLVFPSINSSTNFSLYTYYPSRGYVVRTSQIGAYQKSDLGGLFGHQFASGDDLNYFREFFGLPYPNGTVTNSFQDGATTIAQAPSINLSATLPQNVKENINSWDGTQDLVLAPPIPWDIPDDDLIIVTPTTGEGTVNPPIDPPDIDTPFPWLETALGSILAGEFFTGLDSSLKTASKALGDVINPTITALEKTITDSLTGIQTQVGDIGKTVTEIGSNILAFPQTLTDFFALPVDVTWFDPLIEPFTLKMPIINQLKDGIGLMFNQDTRPLIIIYPYQGEDRRITLDWYEPMRLQVRSGLGFIFTILLILSLFKLLSSVFGMGNIGTITKSMKGD